MCLNIYRGGYGKVKEIENCSHGSSKLTQYKSRTKGIVLMIIATTLSGIFERIKFKFIKFKKIDFLSPEFMNKYILNKIGLEIGGASNVYRDGGPIPLYDLAKSIDNVNYSRVTIWNNQNKERFTSFRKTIINEATDLCDIESNSYDFVASSNVIEHLSNPLLSLLEMKRVVKSEGLIIAIVPHHDITFDHRRQVTSLDSLIKCFTLNISDGDIAHLDLNEIFKNYDLTLDPQAGNLDSFKKRTLNNKSIRALHQTVFNTQLMLEMFNCAEIKILAVRTSLILGHILVIGTKIDNSKDEVTKSNLHFLTPKAKWRNNTIFRSERTKNS